MSKTLWQLSEKALWVLGIETGEEMRADVLSEMIAGKVLESKWYPSEEQGRRHFRQMN